MSSNAVVLPSNLPVGFRFSPTEEEVICHYLRFKNLGMDSQVDTVISEVEFYKWDPWELKSKSKIKSKDQVWWFFSRIDYKYSNSKRSNRRTKSGFWKITGKGQKIKGQSTNGFIGGKRILVFNQDTTPAKGTDHFVMHEYYTESENAHPNQRAYVVCRLEQKPDEKGQKAGTPDYDRGEPSGQNMPDHQNRVESVTIPVVHGPNQENLESLFLPPNWSNSLVEQPLNFQFDEDTQALFSGDESEENIRNFVNSCIVEPEEEENDPWETTDNIFNNSNLRDSSKRSYFLGGRDSSDTDNEGFNEQYTQILQGSSSFDLPGSSKKIRHMQMVRTPSEYAEIPSLGVGTSKGSRISFALPGVVRTPSEYNKRPTESASTADGIRHMRMVKTPSKTLHTSTGNNAIRETIVPPPLAPPLYYFSEEDASSDELTAYVRENNSLDLVKKKDEEEISWLDFATEGCNYVSVRGRGRQKRIQPQKKVSFAAISRNKGKEAAKHTTVSVDQLRKEKSIAESPKVVKKAQSSNSERHFKSERCESTGSNWKSFFTFVETSSVLSCDSTPPSVYVFNAIIGTFLFLVFIRELVLFGSWC